MADERSPFHFEDVPLEEARRIGWGRRTDPVLVDALTRTILSLSTDAVRIRFGEEVNVTTMKNRILRIASELGVPVTVRRVPEGLIFWRSTDEDVQQANEIRARLQTAQRRPQARPRGRRPRQTR